MTWSEETQTHLKEHIDYPATGHEIVTACENMSHVNDDEKKMVMDKIDHDKTYDSSEEVIAELNG